MGVFARDWGMPAGKPDAHNLHTCLLFVVVVVVENMALIDMRHTELDFFFKYDLIDYLEVMLFKRQW